MLVQDKDVAMPEKTYGLHQLVQLIAKRPLFTAIALYICAKRHNVVAYLSNRNDGASEMLFCTKFVK
ncbi:unnamed protein product [Urochloa humidicola]